MNRSGQPAQNSRSHGFSNVITSVNRNTLQPMASPGGRGKTPVPIWGFNSMQQSAQAQTQAQAHALAQQQQSGGVRSNPSIGSYASLSSNLQPFSAGLDLGEFPALGQAKSPFSGVSSGSQYGGINSVQYARSGTQSPLSMGPRNAPPGLAQQGGILGSGHGLSALEQHQQQVYLQQQQQQQQQQLGLDLLPSLQDDKNWPDDPLAGPAQSRNGSLNKRQPGHVNEHDGGRDLDDHSQEFGSLRQPVGDIWQFNSNQPLATNNTSNTGVLNDSTMSKGLDLLDSKDLGGLKNGEDMPYGLSGLLNFMKQENNSELGLQALGSDLTAGLNPNHPDTEPLSLTFASPWAETSTSKVEPDFHLPSCYHVQSAPPQQTKIANFKDETLFYIFYSMPRDLMQEAAAAELTNRHWRYHKELKLWLTKEIGSEPIQSTPHYERGVYTFFDPASWERVKKEYVLYYEAIA